MCTHLTLMPCGYLGYLFELCEETCFLNMCSNMCLLISGTGAYDSSHSVLAISEDCPLLPPAPHPAVKTKDTQANRRTTVPSQGLWALGKQAQNQNQHIQIPNQQIQITKISKSKYYISKSKSGNQQIQIPNQQIQIPASANSSRPSTK